MPTAPPDLELDRLPGAIRRALDRELVLVETLPPGLSVAPAGDDHLAVLDDQGAELARFPLDWLRPVDADLVRAGVLEQLRTRPRALALAALDALVDGDIDAQDLPFDDRVAVRMGPVTVALDRGACVRR